MIEHHVENELNIGLPVAIFYGHHVTCDLGVEPSGGMLRIVQVYIAWSVFGSRLERRNRVRREYFPTKS